MTSFHCLQVSFIRSCGKYSPYNFDVKNIDLYNIIIMLRSIDVITSFVSLLTLMLLLTWIELFISTDVIVLFPILVGKDYWYHYIVGSKSLSLREKSNLFCNREILDSNKSNRMRNISQIINWEHGKEALAIFRKWENLNMKMCDYQNHRRFLLRCLGNGIIPVSREVTTSSKKLKEVC